MTTLLWLSRSLRLFFVQFFCVFLPLLNLCCFFYVLSVSVLYCTYPCMNYSLDSSCFLEEFSSFFHCFVFLYFFALVIEDLLISSCCSLKLFIKFSSVHFSHSVVSDLCNFMDCNLPGFPVHHQLLKLAQTHALPVSDAIQPSHPLSSPSPLAFNLSSIRVFSKKSVLPIRWPKYWNFSFSISPSNEYSGLISFSIGWFDLPAVQGTLKSLLQHHSSKASILRHLLFFMV